MPEPRIPATPRALARPRPDPGARFPRSRPDPNPMRMLLGLAGIASASAITSALLPSVLPREAAPVQVAEVVPVPQPSVVHVTRVVQLLPGQTPPPQALVVVQPTPKPRIHVVTTRQSGMP